MSWLVASVGILLLVGIAFSIRYAWWRRTVDYRRPRILMYHMIRPPLRRGRFNKLRVCPAEFERQLEWLVDHGWRFATLSELATLENTHKTVALTFDDGFRDNYETAHPLLAKHGAKATLFLVVDRMDRDWSIAKKAHHDSGELRAEPKLTNGDVRAMLASGVWELGAHTLTHPLLTTLNATEKKREIATAKAQLEAEFDTEVCSFAYPFGIFDAADKQAVADAGYRFAVTTAAGISTSLGAAALTLKRVKVSGREGWLGFAIRLRTGRRGMFE